jgi:hypothetical protein
MLICASTIIIIEVACPLNLKTRTLALQILAIVLNQKELDYESQLYEKIQRV